MIRGNSEVGNSLINHPPDGIYNSAGCAHLPGSIILEGGHDKKMSKQFVGTVNQVNIHT